MHLASTRPLAPSPSRGARLARRANANNCSVQKRWPPKCFSAYLQRCMARHSWSLPQSWSVRDPPACRLQADRRCKAARGRRCAVQQSCNLWVSLSSMTPFHSDFTLHLGASSCCWTDVVAQLQLTAPVAFSAQSCRSPLAPTTGPLKARVAFTPPCRTVLPLPLPRAPVVLHANSQACKVERGGTKFDRIAGKKRPGWSAGAEEPQEEAEQSRGNRKERTGTKSGEGERKTQRACNYVQGTGKYRGRTAKRSMRRTTSGSRPSAARRLLRLLALQPKGAASGSQQAGRLQDLHSMPCAPGS